MKKKPELEIQKERINRILNSDGLKEKIYELEEPELVFENLQKWKKLLEGTLLMPYLWDYNYYSKQNKAMYNELKNIKELVRLVNKERKIAEVIIVVNAGRTSKKFRFKMLGMELLLALNTKLVNWDKRLEVIWKKRKHYNPRATTTKKYSTSFKNRRIDLFAMILFSWFGDDKKLNSKEKKILQYIILEAWGQKVTLKGIDYKLKEVNSHEI